MTPPTPTIEDSIDILFAAHGKLDLQGYKSNEYAKLRASLTLLITKARIDENQNWVDSTKKLFGTHWQSNGKYIEMGAMERRISALKATTQEPDHE